MILSIPLKRRAEVSLTLIPRKCAEMSVVEMNQFSAVYGQEYRGTSRNKPSKTR